MHLFASCKHYFNFEQRFGDQLTPVKLDPTKCEHSDHCALHVSHNHNVQSDNARGGRDLQRPTPLEIKFP